MSPQLRSVRWSWVSAVVAGVVLAIGFCAWTGVLGETAWQPEHVVCLHAHGNICSDWILK